MRTVIGAGLYYALFTTFYHIPSDNYLTDFLFRHIFAYFCLTYILYGTYPMIWYHIGLVDLDEWNTDENASKYKADPIHENSSDEASDSDDYQKDESINNKEELEKYRQEKNIDSMTRQTYKNHDDSSYFKYE